MPDENVIQPVVTSPVPVVEPVKGGEPVIPAVPAPVAPLTKEDILQLLKDSIPALIEPAKRDIQSAKDRSLAEMARQAKVADAMRQRARQTIIADNPELEEKIKLAEYEARDEASRSFELENENSARVTERAQQIQGSLLEMLSENGIDPKDPKVDWAQDTNDYATGLRRFNKSVSKILKEKETQKEADLNKKLADREKDTEARVRKDLGFESVNIIGGSVPIEGIPTDINEFRAWVKNNPDAYRKNRTKVQEMQKQGLIK
jgi:AraC-like DNA-binding protein